MDALPGVKIFANCAVGYDNIDVAAAKERGVLVTNTPGVLSDTTAETAWALLFAASRRIVEADRFARSGEWKSFHYKDFLGQDVYGKTLGVIGAGQLVLVGGALGLLAAWLAVARHLAAMEPR